MTGKILNQDERVVAARRAAVTTIASMPQIASELQKRNLNPNALFGSNLSSLITQVAKRAAIQGDTIEKINQVVKSLVRLHGPQIKNKLPGFSASLEPVAVVQPKTRKEPDLGKVVNGAISWGDTQLKNARKWVAKDEKEALDFTYDRFSQVCSGILGIPSGLVPLQDMGSLTTSEGRASNISKVVTGWELITGKYQDKINICKKSYAEYCKAIRELDDIVQSLKMGVDISTGNKLSDRQFKELIGKMIKVAARLDDAAMSFRNAASDFTTINRNVKATVAAGTQWALWATLSVSGGCFNSASSFIAEMGNYGAGIVTGQGYATLLTAAPGPGGRIFSHPVKVQSLTSMAAYEAVILTSYAIFELSENKAKNPPAGIPSK